MLALEDDGQVWAWGRNDDGQLGVAAGSGRDRVERNAVPQRVKALTGTRVVAVACGRTHSVALDSAGQVYSWGSGDDGVLGHGDTQSRAAPTRCAQLAAVHVASVACGSRHTLALSDKGELFSWGWGVYGQLGHGDVQSRHTPTAGEATALGGPAEWTPC